MWGRVRTTILTFVALLYVAGIPGSVARDVLLELSAPALPKGLEGRDGVLDVFVKDGTKDDRPPIARARVRAFAILDGRAHDAGLVMTGADGHAKLDRLPSAEHWIVAEAPGFARASQMVVVVAGARRLDLELAEAHFLEVHVKNAEGAAMEGAEIEVRGGGDPFPVGARTGEGGVARVGRLGEGPYFVTVRAVGFEEAQRRRVPEGEVVVVTLSKQGALLVRVVGEDGQPAGGARVLIAAPNLGPQRVAETTADGSVRIGGLDTGSYTLRAVKGTSVSPIEIGVPVSKGEEKSVELRLGPGVMIVAQVVDAVSDDPIAGAKTTLAEGGLSPFPVEGVSDKHGKVVLGPIAYGSASLSARADEYVPKSAVRVEAPPPSEVKIALVRGGVLIGKIKDSRGYAVDGATIRVVGTDNEGMPIDEDPQRTQFREAHFTQALAGPSPLIPAGQLGVMPGPVPPIPHGPAYHSMTFGPARSTAIAPGNGSGASDEGWVSGRDGTFTARPVTPGRVRAYVRHPQYVEAMSDVVTLLPEKEAHVEIVLQRGGILEGKVVDTKGRGVGGVHVTVLATKGSLERMTRTGTDGSFAFAAVPDALTVLVARDDDATNVVARADATVPEGGKATISITLPDVRPALPVRVTDARGTRLEAAQVSAVSLDPAEALRVTAFTDARGEAMLQGAKGLALRIETHAAGKAARVMVTQGESETLIIALGSAESITGEIRNHRGQPLEGATLTLHTEGGVFHARSDKDGVYTIGDLSPGPARMRVRAKGKATVLKDVLVEDRGGRKPTEIPRIELAEEGVVEGVVIDQNGKPVGGARVAKDAVPTYLPVGTQMMGMAVTDAKGRFLLSELAEGSIAIEAYAPDVGRARITGVPIRAGRTTESVKITLVRGEAGQPGQNPAEPLATGGVAVTLGETAAGLEGPEVVIVAVSDNSEAERAGLQVNDIVIEIGGKKPKDIVDARAKLSGPVHDDVVVKVKRGERSVTLRVSREQVRR